MFRLIGAVIGLIFGGLFGAFEGFCIGYLIDYFITRAVAKSEINAPLHKKYTEHILILATKIAKSDQNNLLRSEFLYVYKYLKLMLPPDKVQAAMLRFRDILKENPDIKPICGDLRKHASINTKLKILYFLFGFAQSNGEIRGEEWETLLQISDLCGLDRKFYNETRTIYENSQWENYNSTQSGYGYSQDSYQSSTRDYNTKYTLLEDYRILEILPTATDNEVKKAYRNAAKKYHPDKFNHLGEKARKAAEEKFARINNAYENIKKSRNLK